MIYNTRTKASAPIDQLRHDLAMARAYLIVEEPADAYLEIDTFLTLDELLSHDPMFDLTRELTEALCPKAH